MQAQIVADSVNPFNCRLTSMLLTYPRFIHSELMTHRSASRNAASSRAIPVDKTLARVRNDPAMPVYYGQKQKGMQADSQVSEENLGLIKQKWLEMRDFVCQKVEECLALGLHKQLANRPLETWAPMTTLMTMTELGWQNLFCQRADGPAQPEFQVLAFLALKAYLENTPQKVEFGGWHYVFKDFTECLDENQQLKISTARAARLSYLTFDGNYTIEADVSRHDDLVRYGHWSPFEHCAQAVSGDNYARSNFDFEYVDDCVVRINSYWKQYRKCFSQELRRATNEELRDRLNSAPEWVKAFL